jgi:hypothetical protein
MQNECHCFLFEFDGTHPMNFMMAYGLACTYPKLTLQKQSLLNVEGIISAEPFIWWRGKWVQRGFSVWRMLKRWSDFDGHVCQIDASCPLTVHSIYDTHTMFLEFPRGPQAT